MARSDTSTASDDASSSRWMLIAVVVAVIIVLATVGAIFATRTNDKGDSSQEYGETAEVDPTQLEGSPDPDAQTGTVSITGDPLPLFEDPSNDPAIGAAAPVVSATDFGGRPYQIGDDGSNGGRVIAFLAHWCPHCRDELPVLVNFAQTTTLPDNVEMIAVSTAVDPSEPNFPPYSWFAEAQFPGLVLRDNAEGAFANAYGLTGFPYLVAVDPEGNVAARMGGAATPAQLAALVEAAAG